MLSKVSVCWFRRDLRIEDNHALFKALNSPYPVLALFIVDTNIVDELKSDDARFSFIYEQLCAIDAYLKKHQSSLCILKDTPENAWNHVLKTFDVQEVYANEDYEPYARNRDGKIHEWFAANNIPFTLTKDQVVFARDEIRKADGTPYTIYTPYKNKWRSLFQAQLLEPYKSESLHNYLKIDIELPTLEALGFVKSTLKIRAYKLNDLEAYKAVRDFPAVDATSYLSPHLRFGTVSIRQVILKIQDNQSFLDELIWREFFMQILYHFPKVVQANFKSKYDGIQWRNNKDEFEKWKKGETGYPLVDAGMRQLNKTGYMHNRVRMVVAGFLCKHLLIDWRWGEAYFAEKLLDYELSSNNGNWQWAAGTGCDAAPYFRVFNPITQLKKFDPDLHYVKKWIPELNELTYPLPMVDHKMARKRALETYKIGLQA